MVKYYDIVISWMSKNIHSMFNFIFPVKSSWIFNKLPGSSENQPDMVLTTGSLCKHDALIVGCFLGCALMCCCLCRVWLGALVLFLFGALGRGDGHNEQPVESGMRCGNWDVLSSTERGHSESMCGVHALF